MTWAVYEVESKPPDEDDFVTVVHVWPQFGPRHSDLGDTCWCGPDCERFENGNFLVTHRVMH